MDDANLPFVFEALCLEVGDDLKHVVASVAIHFRDAIGDQVSIMFNC
jgi:hypothetical protein